MEEVWTENLRICISNKLLAVADGLQTTLFVSHCLKGLLIVHVIKPKILSIIFRFYMILFIPLRSSLTMFILFLVLVLMLCCSLKPEYLLLCLADSFSSFTVQIIYLLYREYKIFVHNSGMEEIEFF